MLPEVKNGRLICKRLQDPPKLQAIDPDFGEEYDEAKHGDTLQTELNIAHLTPHAILVRTIRCVEPRFGLT